MRSTRRGGVACAASVGATFFLFSHVWGCEGTDDSATAPLWASAEAGGAVDTGAASAVDGALLDVNAKAVASDAGGGATSSDSGHDAASDAEAHVCIQSLSGVGTADFRVSFKLRTTAKALSMLVYQRSICAHAEFWDIHMMANGRIGAETDNSGAQYVELYSTSAVNDGAVHEVIVDRVSRILRMTIDGRLESSASSLTNFGVLSPLGSVSGDPCQAYGSVPLVGTLSELCVSGPPS